MNQTSSVKTSSKSGAFSDLPSDVRWVKHYVEGRRRAYAATAWCEEDSFTVSVEDIGVYDDDARVILGFEKMPASFPSAGVNISVVIEDPEADRFLCFRVLERLIVEITDEK